jgi:hypothetical protein
MIIGFLLFDCIQKIHRFIGIPNLPVQMIYYEFFSQDSLLIIRYDGEISDNEFSEFFRVMFIEAKKYKIKGVLNDLRKTIFGFNIELLGKISEIRSAESEIYSDFKSVHLINDNQQTTYSIFFKESTEKRNTDFVTCSTLAYAIYYLNIAIDELEFEERIRNLNYCYKPIVNE